MESRTSDKTPTIDILNSNKSGQIENGSLPSIPSEEGFHNERTVTTNYTGTPSTYMPKYDEDKVSQDDQNPKSKGETDKIVTCNLVGDKYLVLGTGGGILKVFEVETKNEVYTYCAEPKIVKILAIATNNLTENHEKHIVVSYGLQYLKVLRFKKTNENLEVNTGEQPEAAKRRSEFIQEFDLGTARSAKVLVTTPDDKYFIAGTRNGILKLFLNSGDFKEVPDVFSNHKCCVSGLKFDRFNRFLASRAGRQVWIWEYDPKNIQKPFSLVYSDNVLDNAMSACEHNNLYDHLDFSMDGMTLFCSDWKTETVHLFHYTEESGWKYNFKSFSWKQKSPRILGLLDQSLLVIDKIKIAGVDFSKDVKKPFYTFEVPEPDQEIVLDLDQVAEKADPPAIVKVFILEKTLLIVDENEGIIKDESLGNTISRMREQQNKLSLASRFIIGSNSIDVKIENILSSTDNSTKLGNQNGQPQLATAKTYPDKKEDKTDEIKNVVTQNEPKNEDEDGLNEYNLND